MKKLIVVSAPSGAGKTSIVRFLLKQNLGFSFSVSACNREKRVGEVEGEDYYFLSTKDFKNRIEEGAFLEWEEVYQGRYYGTLNSEIQRIWDQKKHVVFDVDVIGGISLKEYFKENSISIFIKPPSIEVLSKRLKKRNTEDRKSIKNRLEKSFEEMKSIDKFDKIIVNDELNISTKNIIETVEKFLK